MNQLFGFGGKSGEEINAEIEENVPNNTKNTRESVWKQFHTFIQDCIHLLKIFDFDWAFKTLVRVKRAF
jgi:hypothetical protein